MSLIENFIQRKCLKIMVVLFPIPNALSFLTFILSTQIVDSLQCCLISWSLAWHGLLVLMPVLSKDSRSFCICWASVNLLCLSSLSLQSQYQWMSWSSTASTKWASCCVIAVWPLVIHTGCEPVLHYWPTCGSHSLCPLASGKCICWFPVSTAWKEGC